MRILIIVQIDDTLMASQRSPDIQNLHSKFRHISIDYSENFFYNYYRTDVCVCKGVRQMDTYKDKLIKLLDKLSEKQIEYIYYLIVSLFGHTPD